eukprot:s862_g11.t3
MGDAAASQKSAPGVSRRSRLAGLGVAKPWQVVGGEATGGIIVRAGPDTNSILSSRQLAVAALIPGIRAHGLSNLIARRPDLLVRAGADHKEAQGAKPGASPLVVQEARALPLRPAASPQLHASSKSSEANDAPPRPAKETQAEEEDSAATFWQLGKLATEQDATIERDLQTAVQSMCVPGRFSYGDLSSLGQAMVAERMKRSSMGEKRMCAGSMVWLVQVQQRSEGGPENLLLASQLYQSLVERHTLEQWEAQLEKLVTGYSVMKVARNGKLYNRSFWLAGGSLRTNGRFNSGIAPSLVNQTYKSAMSLPSWMCKAFYANAVLDLVVFLIPGSIAVPDLIAAKFPAGKRQGEIEQLIQLFHRQGGFAFLLHGAVRFCAGYYQTEDMVYLALFSYAVEAAELLYFYAKGTAVNAIFLVLFGITDHLGVASIYLAKKKANELGDLFCGAVSQEFIKLRRIEREPPKKSGSLAGGLLRTFVASKPMTQEHPDPEEAGVVIIATGGRSFSLLFLGGAAERDEFAELDAQRCLLRDHYLVRSARAEGNGQTFQVLRGCLLLKMIRAVGKNCHQSRPGSTTATLSWLGAPVEVRRPSMVFVHGRRRDTRTSAIAVLSHTSQEAAAEKWRSHSAVKALAGPRQGRWALLQFSDRPLAALTRPSLEDFVGRYPGRYDLLFEEESLVDPRDFHPSWNKLAYARRVLILGDYDAVVCLDDDILITNPRIDPIHEALVEHFIEDVTSDSETLVVASLDEQVNGRVPFNTGVLALRSSPLTLNLLDKVFQIGRRLKLIDGNAWLPRITGLWDQDAFAEYIQTYGFKSFALLPHGQLQSFVRAGKSHWIPGAFAAHFTGLSEETPQRGMDLLRDFLKALPPQGDPCQLSDRIEASLQWREHQQLLVLQLPVRFPHTAVEDNDAEMTRVLLRYKSKKMKETKDGTATALAAWRPSTQRQRQVRVGLRKSFEERCEVLPTAPSVDVSAGQGVMGT